MNTYILIYKYYFLNYYGEENYKMIRKIMKQRYNLDLDTCLEYSWNYLKQYYNDDIIASKFTFIYCVLFYQLFEHNRSYIFKDQIDKCHVEHILNTFNILYYFDILGDYLYVILDKKMYNRIKKLERIQERINSKKLKANSITFFDSIQKLKESR